MCILKIATVLAVTLSCALAQHGYAQYAHAPVHVVKEVYAHPKYEFQYGVKDAHTGDIKEQHEARDGDHVQGHYSLVEADGTRRIVHYTADDKNGFNAVVTKEGHAAHPVAVPVKHVQPVVHYAHAPVAIAHAPIAVHSHQPAVAYSSVNLGHSQGQGYGQGHGYAAPIAVHAHQPAVAYSSVNLGHSQGHGYAAPIAIRAHQPAVAYSSVNLGHSQGHGYGLGQGRGLGLSNGYGIGQARGYGQGIGISHGYSLGGAQGYGHY